MCDCSDSSHPLSGCNSHFRQATALFEILWRVSCICSSTVSILISQLHGQPSGGNPNAWGYPGCFAGKSHLWINTFFTSKNRMRILRSWGRYQSSTAPSACVSCSTLWPCGGFRMAGDTPNHPNYTILVLKTHGFADPLFWDMSMLVAKV